MGEELLNLSPLDPCHSQCACMSIHIDLYLRCRVSSSALVPLWDYTITVLVCESTFFKDSYQIVIADDLVGLLIGSELGSTLGDMLYSYNWPPIGLQFIMDIPYGSKVRYSDLVGSLLRATLTVPPSGYCLKFSPPPSGTCLFSPSRKTLDVTLSVG